MALVILAGWVGRVWRDFSLFSFSCFDLLGNNFGPFAQAGSVVPVLLFCEHFSPSYLDPGILGLIFSALLQLEGQNQCGFGECLALGQHYPGHGHP